MKNSSYPATYKPSATAYKKWLKDASIPTLILAMGMVLVIALRWGIAAAILTVLAGVGIGALLALIYIKQSAVIITDSQIQIKQLFRTVMFERKTVRGLVTTSSLLTLEMRNDHITMVYLKSNSSSRKARLNPGYWAQEDLEAIAKSIEPKNLIRDGMRNPKDLVKEHGEFLMFIENGGVFAVIITTLVILALFGCIGLVVWLFQ